jgi:predicted RNase H-like nuclease (RuvC/YqgF family)
MERMERNEKNDAQKAKLFFLSLALVVAGLLVWSVVSANKARSERDAVKREVEALKQDNAKLEQMVKDLNQENESLKKKVQQAQAKPKAKPAAKKKAKHTKKTSKKKPPKITNVN